MLNKIFNYFTQVDSTLRRRAEGSEFTIELPVRLVNEELPALEDKSISNVERIKVEFSDIYL